MPQNLGWREAILHVLRKADGPIHYTEIADRIAESELREDLGATPANTVAAIIAMSLQKDRNASPFIRIDRGLYGLRNAASKSVNVAVSSEITAVAGVVNAFGMFWDRSKVSWTSNPKILGQQQAGAKQVNFCEQRGVYLLHDAQGVVYVGRTTEQSLGRRLYQHTADRLSGRWDRFSWFGVYEVKENGNLQTEATLAKVSIDTMIATMEAVLIEGLEPRQNRKRGDDFQAVEFLQVEDPALRLQRQKDLITRLLSANDLAADD